VSSDFYHTTRTVETKSTKTQNKEIQHELYYRKEMQLLFIFKATKSNAKWLCRI